MLFVYFSLYNISFHWVSLGAGQVRLDSDRGLEMAVSSCGMVRAQLDQLGPAAGRVEIITEYRYFIRACCTQYTTILSTLTTPPSPAFKIK